ncbi:4-carboxy-2-hydroxymuconate-6-semialdehyde dehydrogenase [Streptomyces malaysiensis subsp. malaysiensis]|uniref:Gfo/Idh/MocA family protein n=2 Tax=Streptomyces malaysiensis TaxID=92644 RepID=UPI000C2CC2F1|nr:Gfo/Idh/MocA family oxidoreductase [Streptomyces sp. M56]AUA08982.1 4-carboxy-2-hydroxymuconate-6-semialdehyde dehydrogenase [Streptomyces sp. M56]
MRFGVLGTGHWAAETHAAALAAHPVAELAGIWGRDPEKAKALADRWGTRAYPDADALIADVDAVAIALPPDLQSGLAERAALAGRHLLLDKPLAFTTEEADRIVRAVDERGLASVVFFTNRFAAPVETFIEETAAAGGWDGGRATAFASIFQPGGRYGESRWRRERGGLWDVGPHSLSVLLPVLGPVAEVTALDGPRGAAHVLLRHQSGAIGTLALTLDARPAAQGFSCDFYGERGIAVVPEAGTTAVAAFATAVDRLLSGARDGGAPDPCDVRFAREVVAVLEAADRSRHEGHTVTPR